MTPSADSYQPFKPLHGERQGFIELLDDAAGCVQAAVLELERMTVALVKTGQTSELGGQQGAVVGRHGLGRGALLRETAERVGGRRRGGGGLQRPWRHANHHFLGRQRWRVLSSRHTGQLHWLARI